MKLKVSGIGTSLRNWLIVAFIGMFAFSLVYNVVAPDNNIDTPTGFVDGFCLLLVCASIVGTFVLGIIHLIRYREKGFAITSLVISSIYLVIFAVAFIIGLIIGIMAL